MKVAITGARGRLAPWLAAAFQEARARVNLFSRVGGGEIHANRDFPGPEVPDAVLHCAWSTVPFTAENSPGCFESQDLPLLESLLARAPGAHFVFLSTGAVYGNTGPHAADESRPPAPLGEYARGKLRAENCILQDFSVSGLVLRIGNLLGERAEPARPQGILPRLIEAARTGRPVEVWGDGSAAKDYLHCKDFCHVLVRLVQMRATGIFNVGAGVCITVHELMETVERVIGRPVPRIYREAYPWDVREGRLNCSKIRRVTQWAPALSVEDAILESWTKC